MRLLFTMDRQDHGDCTRTYVRNSARGIIIRDGKVAMIHSLKYDYYKFPGGGIEKDERPVDAMIRETREEAGLLVIPETVREFGYVHRVQRSGSDPAERFVQDNYYFLCEARETITEQELDDYESKERFTLEFVEPMKAIYTNRHVGESPHNGMMFEREARILEMLIAEGFLKTERE